MPKAKKKKVPAKPRTRKVAGKAGDGRDHRGRLLPGYTPPGSGGVKGALCISARIRKQLKRHRGDRETIDRILDRYFDLLVKGTDKDITRMLRDGLGFLTDRLEGKPAQTVIADVTRHDSPIDRLPSEERKTVLRRYLEDYGVEGALD